MGWFEKYNAVFMQVKAVLESVDDVKTVCLGGAFRVGEMPMAVVVPRETVISQGDLGNVLSCMLNFDVVLFIRESEPENWFTEILPPMGKILDTFLADRTLNGAVMDLTPTIFSPGEITALNKLYYGGLIRFKTFYHFTL